MMPSLVVEPHQTYSKLGENLVVAAQVSLGLGGVFILATEQKANTHNPPNPG